MTMLPPGLHPHDRRATPSGPGGTVPYEVGAQQGTAAPNQGRPSFAVPNARAMGVWQRACRTWNGRPERVTTAPVKIVGRKKGRLSVALWVPSKVVIAGVVVTVSAGVLVAASAGEAAQYAGIVLDVGDSITIPSEASVYAIALPGSTTGYVQYSDFYNPAVGAPGT